MAPNSYHSSTSSVEALNGSAATSQSRYQTDPPSYSAPASITHATYANLARYPAGVPQSNGTSNYTSVNGNHAGFAHYGHENDSYASRGQSQVPTTYATSYYSAESEQANQPYSNDTYYPPSTISYAGDAVYTSDLSIEEQDEQNGVANEQYSQEDGAEPEEIYSSDYTRPHHSPSIRRWSRRMPRKRDFGLVSQDGRTSSIESTMSKAVLKSLADLKHATDPASNVAEEITVDDRILSRKIAYLWCKLRLPSTLEQRNDVGWTELRGHD